MAVRSPVAWISGLNNPFARVYMRHLFFDGAEVAQVGFLAIKTAEAYVERCTFGFTLQEGLILDGCQNGQWDKILCQENGTDSLLLTNEAANNVFVSFNSSNSGVGDINISEDATLPGTTVIVVPGSRDNTFFGGIGERVKAGATKQYFLRLNEARNNRFIGMNPYQGDYLVTAGIVTTSSSANNTFDDINIQSAAANTTVPAIIDAGYRNVFRGLYLNIYGASGSNVPALIQSETGVFRDIKNNNSFFTKLIEYTGTGTSTIAYTPVQEAVTSLPDVALVDAGYTVNLNSNVKYWLDPASMQWRKSSIGKGSTTKNDGAITFDVENVEFLYINEAAPVTIETFTGAEVGQVITVYFANTNATLENVSGGADRFYLGVAGNYTPALTRNTITLIKTSTTWREVCRAG